MSHKVQPKSFRIKKIDDWDSRGFYEKKFSSYLEQDFKIRDFLEKKTKRFGVGRIVIERSAGRINIIIFTARPGLIIGRAGEGIDKLRKQLQEKVLKTEQGFKIEIREIKNSWTNAELVVQWIAGQIEKRTPYRRVLKRALAKIISNKEVKGVKVEVAGRLNGIDIARREWLKQGPLPRQNLRADIDYAHGTAFCTYGVIGIKVWIYKGEKL